MRRRVWLPTLVIALLVGGYALAGFVFAPRWVAGAFRDFVTQQLKLEPALATLRINPFTLSAEARGIAIRERSGAPLVAIDRLYVNASIASLWHLEPVLDEVTIEHPVVTAQLRADGSLNLDALVPAADPKAPPAKPGAPLPGLHLAQLQIHKGELNVDDLGEQPALHAHFAPIELRVHDFATRGKGGDTYEIEAVGPAGARFSLNGHFAPQPFSVEGNFGVEAMQALALSGYAHDFLPFDMTGGELRLASHYRVASEPAALSVEFGIDTLEGKALELKARTAMQSEVRLATLRLEGGAFSLAKRQLSLGSVLLGGLELDAVLEPQGLNLMRLLADGTAPAATPVAAVAPGGKPAAAPWLLTLPKLHVQDGRVHFIDRTAPLPAPFELSGVDVVASDYSTQAGSKLPLTVAATVGEAGRFSAQLTVRPEAPSAEGKVALAGFDLRSIQPYLANLVRLDLRSGEADFEGQLHVTPAAKAGGPPRVAFEGKAGVQRLDTLDRQQHKDFVRWDSLRLGGLRYRSEPAQLAVKALDLDRPYVDLVIARDATTNLADVLTANSALLAPAAGEPAAAVAAPPLVLVKPAPRSAAKAKRGARTSAPAAAAGPVLPLQVTVDAMNIQDGSANFEDYSIKPNFVTGLQSLTGTITGISSDPDSRAVLLLDGAVDKYAPAHFAGEVNLLAAEQYMNIKASFRNMELTSLSPYSGKFAGYAIERGKLSIDVSYLIRNRAIEAQHKILLTQLQLGDKVDSPDATGLPLRLVVALLKDADGNIDLDIPVTGDLDDPKFRVGPIIWKVFLNLCSKAVTAPFALLGKLFGGGDDLQFVDFAAGAASLDDAMSERVAKLKKALQARPGLSLEIPLGSNAELDGAAIRASAWATMLDGIAPVAVRSDRAQYQKRLEKAYSEAYGKPLPPPGPPAPPAPAPAGAAAAAAAGPPPTADALREARIGALEEGLKAKTSVGQPELEALGKARAQAVQDALLASGEVDPLRVFIVAPAASAASAGKVRVQVAIRS